MRISLSLLLSALSLAAAVTLQDACVADVNALRAVHGAPPVVWDAGLASVAQSWAEKLAAEDKLDHSSSPYGENIAEVRLLAPSSHE